jgi:biopolymer transport protein ExbD
MSEINITPFTDVLLVLLIIFMILASLMVPPGFQRAMGCTQACPGKPDRPALTRIELFITRAGKFFIGTTPADQRSIYAELAKTANERHVPRLSIIADARAPYGLVIRALDAAKAANISDVSFVTQ